MLCPCFSNRPLFVALRPNALGGVAMSGRGVKLPAWLAPALDPYPKPQDTHSHQPAPNMPAATQQAPVLGNGKRENPVQGTSTRSTVSSTRLVLHVGMAASVALLRRVVHCLHACCRGYSGRRQLTFRPRLSLKHRRRPGAPRLWPPGQRRGRRGACRPPCSARGR